MWICWELVFYKSKYCIAGLDQGTKRKYSATRNLFDDQNISSEPGFRPLLLTEDIFRLLIVHRSIERIEGKE
ncbi:hypothetical protein PanWU01x14_190850 [Parasponia andersonii]|uniref:Uncharacterized protein n=1 Tax=Parasponia andersonii TaxID=3476 RepID=A0A2P5C274_PARAD|nr:hypothetical protein PanWU01x14_190850 [Parasponia andersonii]